MVIAPLSRDVDPGAVLLAHLFPDGDLPGEHALASTLLEEAGPALDFGRLVGRWIALRDRPFEAPEVLQALHHLADSGSPALEGAFGPGLGAAVVTLPLAGRLARSPRNLTAGTFHLARLLDPHPVGVFAAVAVAVTAACLLGDRRDFVPDVLDVLLANEGPPALIEAVRRVPVFRAEPALSSVDDPAGRGVQGSAMVLWLLRHERAEPTALERAAPHGPEAVRLVRALIRLRDVRPGG